MSWKKTPDPRVKKRGEWYHARFSKNGVRIEQGLETRNFAIAVDAVNKIEKAVLEKKDYRDLFSKARVDESLNSLFDELWPEFLIDKSQGRRKIKKSSEKTIREYSKFYERYFKEFWGQKILTDINEESWETYMDFARKKAKKPSMKMFNHWKYMSAFCSWAIHRKKLSEMPVIYNPDQDDEEDGVGKNFTDEELKLMRENSSGPMHLWILMGQYMGMRTGEVTNLHKSRIDWRARLIKLKRGDTKTRTARSVPIHPAVFDKLAEQVEATKSQYVFPNRADSARPMDSQGFKKPWGALREAHGIDGRYHDLRHSYATRVFANPHLNPALICKALGMSMQTAMRVYIHFDEKHLGLIAERFTL